MRTPVLVTRMGIWWGGELASESWVANRLDFARRLSIPAFEKLTTEWFWVWQVAPERFDQVSEAAPDYVHLIRQDTTGTPKEVARKTMFDDRVIDDIPGDRFLTVCLDSDDAYRPRALDWAAGLELGPNMLVNWPNGWRWDNRTGQIWTVDTLDHYQAHYWGITHEERVGMLNIGGWHWRDPRKGRTRIDHQKRAWLQLFHAENMTVRGPNHHATKKVTRPVDPARILARFGLEA